MYITHPTHEAGARPHKTAFTNSNPVGHTDRRPVRAPAQGGQREEQGDPPPQKKGGGTRVRHTAPKPHTHSTGGGQTRQPDSTRGGTHGAIRKHTGGPPCQHQQHPAESSGPPEERTPQTRRHTPHWSSDGEKKKTMGAAQARGEEGRETERPRTVTGSGGHHKAMTQLGRKPPPPPRSAETKRGGWGTNPTHGNSRTPPHHRQPHQKVAANGRGARKGPRNPTPKPEKS